jgi:tetratricopeptide (TPR) repeat protein
MVYERLWEREPADRRTWEPLLELYAKLGDGPSVERVARATVEKLFDPAERNVVRMVRARFLAERDRNDPALVEALREVLAEAPTHQDAIGLLADVYQAAGNEEGLTELLGREIEAARARADVPAVVALSLRLGRKLLASQPGEARDIYRKALSLSPDSPDLMRALVALLRPEEDGRERALLLERLLETETGEEAGRVAMDLAGLWAAVGDEERVLRALEIGVARAAGSRAVFEKLCDYYRERHAWQRLATVLEGEVERRSERADKARLLKEAAELQRHNLGRAREAAELLRRARAFAPEDAPLLSELVGLLDAIGERAVAVEEVSRALDATAEGSPERAPLLQVRADLREKGGQNEAAVADLEEALRSGGAAVEPALRAALQRWREHAAGAGDAAGERRAVLRLVELFTQHEDETQARAVLADWCWRHPDDAESLRLLVARDQAAGRWDAVVESSRRLVEVETGAGQIAAAELLVKACEQLGQSAPAIAGLEAALRAQPENPWLFERLMALYEAAGERGKQASLTLWAAERTTDPDRRWKALRQAGEIYLRERDLTAATAAFQQALALRPGDRELSLLVADVCIAGDKLAEAEAILEALMKKAAKDLSSAELSSVQHKMAQLAAARGDAGGRLEWLKRAFDTNRKNGHVAIELADLAEAANDLDLAVKALRAVTLLPSGNAMTPAMAFFRQARIAQRTGDRPRAVIFAKRALQEDPRLSEAADFLKEMGERRA